MRKVQLSDDTNGVLRDLVVEFANGRGIVEYDGVYLMVDQIYTPGSQVGEIWEFSGEPARPGEELEKLNELVSTVQTTTTVTKD